MKTEKSILIFVFIFWVFLAGCFGCSHPTNIEDVVEESMQKKEGVDIQITPVKEKKQ